MDEKENCLNYDEYEDCLNYDEYENCLNYDEYEDCLNYDEYCNYCGGIIYKNNYNYICKKCNIAKKRLIYTFLDVNNQ